MKSYELMCVFNTKENHYTEGVQAVKDKLTSFGCTVEKEEDMGDRALAYLIGKETRGHYHLFHLQSEEGAFAKLDVQLKLIKPLMRYLLVCKKKVRMAKYPRVSRPYIPRQAPTTPPVETEEA